MFSSKILPNKHVIAIPFVGVTSTMYIVKKNNLLKNKIVWQKTYQIQCKNEIN